MQKLLTSSITSLSEIPPIESSNPTFKSLLIFYNNSKKKRGEMLNMNLNNELDLERRCIKYLSILKLFMTLKRSKYHEYTF